MGLLPGETARIRRGFLLLCQASDIWQEDRRLFHGQQWALEVITSFLNADITGVNECM